MIMYFNIEFGGVAGGASIVLVDVDVVDFSWRTRYPLPQKTSRPYDQGVISRGFKKFIMLAI